MRQIEIRPSEDQLIKVESSTNSQSIDIRKENPIVLHNVQTDKDCLFADVQIQDGKVNLLVDTGSSVSLLSYETFCKLGLSEGSLTKFENELFAADGKSLDIKGCATLEFVCCSFRFEQNFVVASLDYLSGILGMDFLQKYKADLQISRQTLKTSQGKIRVSKQKVYNCARIRTCEKTVVPPNSEVFVECQSDRQLSDSVGLVEPAKYLKSKGVLVAKSLVNPNNDKVVLSVLNLSKKPVKLEPEAIIGKINTVDGIVSIEQSKKNLDSISECEDKLPEHLEMLVDKSSSKLTESERNSVKNLLAQFQDIFVGPDGELGQTDLTTHKIDTKDAEPFKIPPRRVAPTRKKVIEEEVDKMLKQGIIEPSDSPWSSPVCLVTKKDGTCRFCVDYRKLNSVTQKDAYPLPRIDDTLETLGNSKWFSTLDLASGYWQVKLSDADKKKTAFSSHIGLYHFNVMPFGLSNAPATFERLMDGVLGTLKWEKCLCYLDDVIVFGKDFETALENLKSVFLQFRLANLKLKPKKCVLFQQEVTFLGHVVSYEGIKCDPSKTESIEQWPRPVSKTEVRSFLGLVSYYRRFVPNFSEIAAPLTRLTRKRVKYEWSDQCEEAFQKLKQSLINPPVLAFPTEDDTFILDTDASAYGLGCVLSQIQHGEEKVIAYSSRTMNKGQQNYCTTKRELLAVVIFLKQFKHYLYGRKFLIRTDHAPLIWLRNFKDAEGMLARWLSVIETFDYEIQYRPGTKHRNADALSRKPFRKCGKLDCPDCISDSVNSEKESVNKTSVANDKTAESNNQEPFQVFPVTEIQNSDINVSESESSWLPIWTRDELLEMQKNDSCIGPILNKLLNSESRPPKSEIINLTSDAKSLWSQWNSLKIENGLLYRRKSVQENEHYLQLVAPKVIRSTIFEHLHKNRTAGHFGRDKTIESINRRFYWPGITENIKSWCKSCEMCAKCKPGPGKGKTPLKQLIVRETMECIAIDIMGPLPRTKDGNEFIMVVGDYYSKWKEAFALKDHKALTVADKLVTEVICRFGCPKQIHTDQGREFESQLFAEMCKLLGIQKSRTTPYRPQSDGLVERFNRTLKQMLSLYVDEDHSNWDEQLPFLLLAYRMSVHKSTNCSPNLMMLGREINCPLDVMVSGPEKSKERICPIEYVEWLKDSMRSNFEFANKHLETAAISQKRNYDIHLNARTFEIGDWVWRFYPPKAGQKLGLGWTGPFLIVSKVSDLVYGIQKDEVANRINVHVDHLKPYEGRNPPRNWLSDVSENNNQNVENSSQGHLLELSNNSEENSFTDNDVNTVENPATPVRTRVGRVVKPRNRYSP